MEKNNKLFIILISIIFLISCQKDKSTIEIELENLNIKSEEYMKIDTSFYQNNIIEKLRFVKSDNEDIRVFFYENGKKKSMIPVKNSQVHGKCIDWYKNGKTKWKREYDYGNFIGLNEEYDSLGIIKSRTKYLSYGEEHTVFFKNGEPSSLISDSLNIHYYLNNKIQCKYYQTNTELDSVKFYNENGSIVFEGESDSNFDLIKNSKPFSGEIIGRFINGDTAYYFNRINGKFNGRVFFKYGNGQLEAEMYFENGKRKGIHKSYYLNGKPRSYNDYENKINKYWDENGKEI